MLRVYHTLNALIVLYSNGLSVWHGLPDITTSDVKVNNGR